MQNKLTFNDLSFWLKVAVVYIFVNLGFLAYILLALLFGTYYW